MKKKNAVFRNITLISQLSINILVPTFLCLLAGMWLDSKLGTSFWAVILLVIGILSGGKSAYTIAMNSLKMDEEQEEKPEDIVARYNKEKGKGAVNERVSKKD